MLEKPELDEEKISACVRTEYGLTIHQVEFLPLGADVNTAVYQIAAEGGTGYFLKLRKGAFDETSVLLPKYLSQLGIGEIIPPLATHAGRLWGSLDDFKVILYPYVAGRDGYAVKLSRTQWSEFGAALHQIHAAHVPAALLRRIQEEAYAPQARETVKSFLARVAGEVFDEPVAINLAAFLNSQQAEVRDLIDRAERLAQILRAKPPERVLCHSDLHAGNLLIDTAGSLHIVDWDAPILAPKERDLMFIGGGQGFVGWTPQEEELYFYRGYGAAKIDAVALAYYRYERILQDIAAFCEQIFLSDAGGEDRQQSLRYVKSNFEAGGVIEISRRADETQGI